MFFRKVRPSIEPYGLQIIELDKLAVYVKAFELALTNHFNTGYHIDEVLKAISTMAEAPSTRVHNLDPEIKSMLKNPNIRDNCSTVLKSIVNDSNQSAKSYIYIQNQLLQMTC
ncbi:hypothetical protein [Vibrio splendidus]|uniref:hypothetical protein n=1 Tax=Vibrio splendidus TaxID=29497 RepID=UPI003D14B2EA